MWLCMCVVGIYLREEEPPKAEAGRGKGGGGGGGGVSLLLEEGIFPGCGVVGKVDEVRFLFFVGSSMLVVVPRRPRTMVVGGAFV